MEQSNSKPYPTVIDNHSEECVDCKPPVVEIDNNFISQTSEVIIEGDLAVVKTIEELRNLEDKYVQALESGVLKGVQVLGYYEEGDTPSPITYYKSDTTSTDDGGSVIVAGTIKVEHKFRGVIDTRYYGVKVNDEENYYIDNIQKALDYNTGVFKSVVIPAGKVYSNKRINVPSNTQLRGEGKYLTILERKVTETSNFDGVAPKFPSENVVISDMTVTGFRSVSGDNANEVYGIVTLKCDNVEVYNVRSYNNQSAGIRIGYHSTLGETRNFKVYNNSISGIWSGHGIEVMRAENGVCYANDINDISEHGYRLVGCSYVNVTASNISDFGLNGVYFGAFGGAPNEKFQYDCKAFGNTIKLQRSGCSGTIFRSNTFNCKFHDNNIIGDGVSEDAVGIRFLSTEGGLPPVDCKASNNKITNTSIGILYDQSALRCHSQDNEIKNTYGGYGIFSRNNPANFNNCHINGNKIIQDNELNQKGIVFTSNSPANINYIYGNEVSQRVINDPIRVTGIGKVFRSVGNNTANVTRLGNSLLVDPSNINFISNINTGTPVIFKTSGTLPAPLTADTTYYVIWLGLNDRFRISTTLSDALGGMEIVLSDTGVGTHSVELLKNIDSNIIKKI